jgi:hypothetical protein
MLAKSDTSIDLVVAAFAQQGVEAAYFVPTDTGMTKSIVDAHEGIRRFLKAKGLHDFDQQMQGPDNKKKLAVKLVFSDHTIDRELSLYRPQTKSGDPRLWVGRLGEYAQPFNLIALIVDSTGMIYIVNCSRAEILASRDRPGSPLHQLLDKASKSDVAEELLEKLVKVSAMGFVESMRHGPTGVGFTLETLLGISANSSRNPDYKGIEIKSGRVASNGRSRNRSDLFSKVPNWKLSTLKSSLEILNAYGYFSEAEQRVQLYCTMKNRPNPQGLYIQLDSSGDRVENLAVGANGAIEPVAVWVLSDLENDLAAKHRETFWVKAQRREVRGVEEFHYKAVTHTRSPLVNNFGLLVETGKIELDYTMHVNPNGKARDHGYKFKIWPHDFGLLFPPPVNYVLSA